MGLRFFKLICQLLAALAAVTAVAVTHASISLNGDYVATSGAPYNGTDDPWATNTLKIGDSAPGGVSITGGSVLNNTGAGTIANVAAASTSKASVSGVGSKWTNTNGLTVGNGGTATLAISDGGSVSAAVTIIGDAAGSSGTVTLGGGSTASSWTSLSGTTVGRFGDGEVEILGGGSASSNSATIAFDEASTGKIMVGGGSGPATWTLGGSLIVGVSGTGTMTIAGNGSVSNTTAFLGSAQAGNGTVSVTGDGASWTNTGLVRVGGTGDRTGTLNINDGGLVIAPGFIGGSAQSSINFDGGLLRITGTNTMSVAIKLSDGGGTIDIPAAANTFTVNGVVSGDGGLVAIGMGTLTLTQANGYGGGTTINGGTVLANNTLGSATGSAAVTVHNAGTFGGTGSIAGSLTLNDTSTLAPGASAGTLAVGGSLVLGSATVSAYDLNGSDTTIGASVNDLVTIGGNLTLDGTLNVTSSGGNFATAPLGSSWRLFTYGGTLFNNGLALGSMPALMDPSWGFVVDTSAAGQVNLLISVVPEAQAWAFGLLVAGAMAGASVWQSRRRPGARRS